MSDQPRPTDPRGNAWPTRFGFNWGSAEVERTAMLPDGRQVITVRTPRRTMEIYVTMAGNIRIFERGKGEWLLHGKKRNIEPPRPR